VKEKVFLFGGIEIRYWLVP